MGKGNRRSVCYQWLAATNYIEYNTTLDLIDGPAGLFHECPVNVRFLRRAVLPFQRPCNGGVVVLPQCPQIGCSRPLDWTCVRYVKDIFQPGLAAAVLVDQGDAFGIGLYPPPHCPIPQLHAGAGRGIRALGIDQKLVVERVFLKPLSRRNVRFYGSGISCRIFCICIASSCRANRSSTVSSCADTFKMSISSILSTRPAFFK